MLTPFLLHIVDSIPGLAAAVLSTGARSPFDDLAGLELSLREQGVKGRVLFDLLFVNGPSDRYYLGMFDGTQFAPYRLKTAEEPSVEFQNLSAKVYQRELAQLDLSLLSPEVKEGVTRGVPV